ncbi:discoidin domain-containing protein [Actinosynnema sp. ALI-1.44]|uniref:discoidin domain-containing protein n=1 Tax=Actinosynnema sp. ALI-1.44 TaxID=1933779 RepID=UPI00192D0A14|nr:discoidin domain-containing protein [Actinosynnema sp. ALI-1.44]
MLVTVGVVSIPSADDSGHEGHGGHRHVIPKDIKKVAADPVLPDAGWTATVDSTAPGTAAGNVLDENNATVWTSAAALPQRLTINMQAAKSVSGLTYLPAGNNANTVGGFKIFVSATAPTPGNWGTQVASGTFLNSAAAKFVPFPPVTGQYVTFQAISTAAVGGAVVSVAELDVHGGGAAPTLDRTGWTVTTDSQETRQAGFRATNAIDGEPDSIWHTKFTPPAPPLPHWIQLDMQASKPVSGLRYLPRQHPNNQNGTIGGYQIFVSDDPNNLGPAVAVGAWPASQAEKTVTFPQKTGRYVRLTATSEAYGGNAGYTSAAEINVLGNVPAQNPKVAGSWGPTIGFPLVPVAAAVVPGNKLVTWAAGDSYDSEPQESGKTSTATMDLNTGVVTHTNVNQTQHDMFCPGTSTLPDGRIMITGGSNENKTTIYNPANNSWAPGPATVTPRGYQSQVTLSDGQVFLIGGSWSGAIGGKGSEIWSPQTNTWKTLPGIPDTPILTADPEGVYRADNHSWLFAAPGGKVFHAGPSKQMHWFNTGGNGSYANAGPRGNDADAMNGNAVMYDIGKILTTGGAPSYWNSYSTRNANLIDINNPASVTVTPIAQMNHPRVFHNSVVLPDGKVVVVGGSSYAFPYSDTTSIMPAEMFDPATNTFTPMGTMAVPRNYHSVATLLPDGRVFSGGGGLCGTCPTNHPDAQIFTPPYLFQADGSPAPRPAITNAPTTAAAGGSINVTTGSAVSSFSLVKMGAVTHNINTDQRRVPLTTTSSNGTTYTLALPADKGVLVPGDYMLFALDANGVPSVASIIKTS